MLNRAQLFATPWTVACQASLSMGLFRQEYWSGLPCPPPGDLPNPGIEPRFLSLQADSLPSELPKKPKNSRVGSLFLLQGIFPIQELNQGLLHCRQIPYQLTTREAQIMTVQFSLVAQSCPTLCNPVDCSLPGSSVHGIIQARILEWVAISFSRGSSRPGGRTQVSCFAGGFFTF